jgi:uncharacterized protein
MSVLSLEDARAWYAPDDPVHGFDHVQRVYAMAERLAQAEGADVEIVRCAVLLHDAVPPAGWDEADESPPEPASRENHHLESARFARRVLEDLSWPEKRITAVLHCIRSHRFRDESEMPATLEAKVLFDADKLDAIGAVGVARAVAYAALHGAPSYARPSATFLAEGRREPDEPHSAYHEYLFKLSRLKDRLYTRTARQVAKARHQFMVDCFQRLEAEWAGEV